MRDGKLPLNEMQALIERVTQGGSDPNVLLVDERTALLDSALAPLVEQGVISEHERLMLFVCLKWGKYPVDGGDILAAKKASKRK